MERGKIQMDAPLRGPSLSHMSTGKDKSMLVYLKFKIMKEFVRIHG